MKQKHNAHYPICSSSWNFKVSEAKLDENEKQEILERGSLNVVCEDCCHKEDKIDEVTIKLLK